MKRTTWFWIAGFLVGWGLHGPLRVSIWMEILAMELPAELPEKPFGWKKQLALHLNFGGGKGAAQFKIFDDQGREMPIGAMYNTKTGEDGFYLIGKTGNSPVMSWN